VPLLDLVKVGGDRTGLPGDHQRSLLWQPRVEFEERGACHGVVHQTFVPQEGSKHSPQTFSHRGRNCFLHWLLGQWVGWARTYANFVIILTIENYRLKKIPLFLDRWWCSLGEFDLLLRLPEPETALEIVLSAFLTGFGEILVGTLDPVVRLSPTLKCRALFKLLSGLV
jgi:hypothetical protein